MNLQDMILSLHNYWKGEGCTILQPCSFPIGAGTLHPDTIFGCLGSSDVKYCYVQPCLRPADGRGGANKNRLLQYYQYQVIIKPSPLNAQELYLNSLKSIGIKVDDHDIRFVHDDWENPSVGASGVGWEVWCDGMEISQFTYMQKIGGVKLSKVACEITYGLERVAMYLQGVDSVFDLKYSDELSYGDLFKRHEMELSAFVCNGLDCEVLDKMFEKAESCAKRLIEDNKPIAAYYYCLVAIDAFNKMEANASITNIQRDNYIARTRKMTYNSCKLWKELEVELNES